MAKTKYDLIHEDLQNLNDKMDTNSDRTNKLDVLVTGNGGQGHEQRITKIEEWKETHPPVCPMQMKQGSILARRAVDAAVMSIVITLFLWILDRFV